MVLPSRSGASHGCDCILCAVPALSGWRLRCFSRQLARRHGITIPLRRNETAGDRMIVRHVRELDNRDAFDSISIPAPSAAPRLATTRPRFPAYGHGHLALKTTCEDASDAQCFSDLSTARAGKANAQEVQAKERSNGTRVHEVQLN